MSGQAYDPQTIQDLLLQLAADAGEPLSPDDAKLEPREALRLERYLDALKQVLSTPAGLIVLRHWVDQSLGFASLFVNNSNIYKNAALADYSRDRMQEIAMADPRAFTDFIYQGYRNQAYEHRLKKLAHKQGR